MTEKAIRREQLDQTHAAVDEHRQAEQRAFQPAKSAESLILQVIGGWENLLGRVNFARFHAAGYGADTLAKEELAKGIRKVADASRVRWPHQQWSAVAAKAKLARHELAHLLYILSVTGDAPDRTIKIVRLGAGRPAQNARSQPGRAALARARLFDAGAAYRTDKRAGTDRSAHGMK